MTSTPDPCERPAERPAGLSCAMPAGSAGSLGVAGASGSVAPTPEAEAKFARPAERRSGCVVYVNSEAIGGESAHGRGLMHMFLYTLTEIAPQPRAIILVGPAVRLALPGSATLESLSLMHEQGVEILILEDSARDLPGAGGIAVGKQATMHAILHTLLQAEKVITP